MCTSDEKLEDEKSCIIYAGCQMPRICQLRRVGNHRFVPAGAKAGPLEATSKRYHLPSTRELTNPICEVSITDDINIIFYSPKIGLFSWSRSVLIV